MTTSFEPVPVGSTNLAQLLERDDGITPNAALFIANELLPMMVVLWPKSTSQINNNLVGNAKSYAHMLKGLSIKTIRDAVIALAEREPHRDFAPEPQYLKSLCKPATKQYLPNNQTGFVVSMSALEMRVYVLCVTGKIRKSSYNFV